MNHAQFWSATPLEVIELHEGYAWREEQTWDKIAWLAEQIINVSGKSVKRPVSRWALLGKKPPGKAATGPKGRESQLLDLAQLQSEIEAAKNGKKN
jgi:hypothetical protein